MKKITLEDGVPIPSKSHKFPFEEMEVGQSFVAGKYTNYLHVNVNNLGNYYCKKNPKLKFSCREDKDGMLRVWRVA